MAEYRDDIRAAMANQMEIMKKQLMLEVIQVVSVCDTYEEFKRNMYGKALEYMREFEADGTLKAGTVDKIINEGKT